MIERDPYTDRRLLVLLGIDHHLLNNSRSLSRRWRRILAQDLGLQLKGQVNHQFSEPGFGVTAVQILAESHAVISTWPECNGFAQVDLVSCVPIQANVDRVMLDAFKPQVMDSYRYTTTALNWLMPASITRYTRFELTPPQPQYQVLITKFDYPTPTLESVRNREPMVKVTSEAQLLFAEELRSY